MPRTSLLQSLVGASLAASLLACGAAPSEESSEDALGAEGASSPADALKIHLSESPSESPRFTFCANPSKASPFHLTNAAWLALASANQYSHLGYFAPQLLDLGFGGPADSLWAQCGRDLGRARDFEIAHEGELKAKKREGAAALVGFMRHRDSLDPENFGVCAREFYERSYTGLDPEGKPELPAAAFKSYLLRKTDDTNWIQFFSAKPYTFVERLMERGSTQVTVARHSTLPLVVVVFRGTEPPAMADLQARDLIDIVKDLDIWKVDLKDYGFSAGWGYAHRGFTSALQSVDDTESTSMLSNKIRALTGGDPNVGVWITGHSLGGALATLMTARLLDRMDKGERFNLRGMYTFGSPMVGNDAFKQKMEESASRHGVPLVRFRNHKDAVTGVPGVKRFMNYHHVGRLALLTPSGLDPASTDTNEPADAVADHDIAGILGPLNARKRSTGYYARIVDELKKSSSASLTACSEPAPDKGAAPPADLPPQP